MAVAMQALQWGMNPFTVASKTFFVGGKLCYEAQLVNAVVTTSNAITGHFYYEYNTEEKWEGHDDPNAWVKVGAILKGDEDITWTQRIYPADQTIKNSPLWKTDPKQQCSYLGVNKWARLHSPGVIMGVYTPDEIEDTPRKVKDITVHAKAMTLEGLADKEKNNDASESEDTLSATDDSGLDKVLAAINAATDKASINAAAQQARQLPEALQTQALPAYQAKLDELRQQATMPHPTPEASHDSTNDAPTAAGIFEGE